MVKFNSVFFFIIEDLWLSPNLFRSMLPVYREAPLYEIY